MIQNLFRTFHWGIILLFGVGGFFWLAGCGYKGTITWKENNSTIKSQQDLKIVEINGSVRVK